MIARNFAPPAAQLQLAERCGVKRVLLEPRGVFDRSHLFEAALRPFVLPDGNRAIERNDR